MPPSKDEILRAARLAAIATTDEEAEAYREEFAPLFQVFDGLAAVDVDGVEAMVHVHEVPAALRADEVQPSLSPDEALGNAPQREGTSFLVPRIIE